MSFKRYITSIVIIGMVLWLLPIKSYATFTYSRSITVNASQVPSTQTNFPMLVAGTYDGTSSTPDLRTTGNGGKVQNASGYDVGFYSNANCSTGKLDWETELYTAATGVVAYWVEVPSIADGTVIYICYGDASISTDQSNVTGVWDANYIFVLHFNETSGTNINDSTSNNNDWTKVGAGEPAPLAGGKVGPAENYDGTNDQSSRTAITIGTTFTFEGWLQPRTPAAAYGTIFTQGGDQGFYLGETVRRPNYYGSGDRYFTTTLTDAVWSHIAVSVSSGSGTFYLNGATNGTGTSIPSSDIANNGGHGGEQLKAYLDEWRLSNSARTTNWLLTEYRNMNAPATFYALGSEVSSSQTTGHQFVMNNEQFIFNNERFIFQ